MADIDRVTTAIALHFPSPPKQAGFGWPAPALNVIDCVLSLNRRYVSFVVPRLKRFEERRPDTTSLADLHQLIHSYDSPLDFLMSELDYRDKQRAGTLLGVTEYLLDELHDHKGDDEAHIFSLWVHGLAVTA